MNIPLRLRHCSGPEPSPDSGGSHEPGNRFRGVASVSHRSINPAVRSKTQPRSEPNSKRCSTAPGHIAAQTSPKQTEPEPGGPPRPSFSTDPPRGPVPDSQTKLTRSTHRARLTPPLCGGVLQDLSLHIKFTRITHGLSSFLPTHSLTDRSRTFLLSV